MSKTLIWVLVGVLVAAVSAVAFVELRPRDAAPAVAAATSSDNTKGSLAESAPTPETPPSAFAAAEVPSGPPASSSVPPSATLPVVPTIDNLIQNAVAYEGQSIALKGTIVTQCTAGCEFALDDGTGVLSVQLEGKGKDRLIPLGKVGRTIQVLGVFHSSPRPQLVIEDPNGWQFVKS